MALDDNLRTRTVHVAARSVPMMTCSSMTGMISSAVRLSSFIGGTPWRRVLPTVASNGAYPSLRKRITKGTVPASVSPKRVLSRGAPQRLARKRPDSSFLPTLPPR
jgi:hypothetical protein